MMRQRIKNMTNIALGAVLMSLCALITVPFAIPFTMQTFALFFLIYYFGGRLAFASAFMYICIGCVGLPVFSSFGAGFGVLIGPTGGFIVGFPICCLVYSMLLRLLPEFKLKTAALSAVSLLTCYLFGCAWGMLYSGEKGFLALIAVYVLPYIVPDVLKLFLAHICAKRLSKIKALR